MTKTGAAIAAYATIAMICFGPATVQSEAARKEYMAQCLSESAGEPERLRWCGIGGLSASEGLIKAVLWPLWLSYMAAKKFDA